MVVCAVPGCTIAQREKRAMIAEAIEKTFQFTRGPACSASSSRPRWSSSLEMGGRPVAWSGRLGCFRSVPPNFVRSTIRALDYGTLRRIVDLTHGVEPHLSSRLAGANSRLIRRKVPVVPYTDAVW